MTDTTGLATVGDVIAALSVHDSTTPLRVAVQPGYPMHHLLTRGGVHADDAEGDGTPPTDPPVVWLVVGEQVGHLRPESAADALRWSRTRRPPAYTLETQWSACTPPMATTTTDLAVSHGLQGQWRTLRN